MNCLNSYVLLQTPRKLQLTQIRAKHHFIIKWFSQPLWSVIDMEQSTAKENKPNWN